ncbi:MAG: hypothetical protein H8E62_10420 [Planctomycetes bacterium]|nr:hypothetical protein [Planctomycetota bacterium]
MEKKAHIIRWNLFWALMMFSSAGFAGVINVPADYSTIQAAIDASVGGDTIIVSPGTYVENIYFGGKDIILTSTDPTDPNVVSATIIDGNAAGSVVTFSGTETSACELTGFTITNGQAEYGGGISGNYHQATMATIANCMITGNTAVRDGGGLYRCNGSITNCTITGNTAWSYGGGLYECDGPISNCTISGNTAVGGGGLVSCSGPITRCRITNNTANTSGGGLDGCNGSITHCIIAGNTATNFTGGGLIFCRASITHCTITGNTAGRNGGGLYDCGPVTNSVIWGNSATVSSDQLSVCFPTYSCIQDWTRGGPGNITGDPLFADTSSADPAEWDLHLKSEGWRWDASGGQWTWDDETSPCIDAGNPGMALGDEPITLDVDPLNRWGENIRINMGAYGSTSEAGMAPPGWALLCDLDNSGNVNLSDFAPLAAAWMQTAENQPPDVSHDGTVDLGDLILFTDEWLKN